MASRNDSSADQLEDGEKWQLNSDQVWKNIANDHVIEAQYSKPNTKGITLYNTPWGDITIDFQRLQVHHKLRGKCLKVRRLSSPQTTWLWYFKGEDGWSQYGEADSQGRCSKVNSSTLEMEYQKNQQGSYQFKVTSHTYKIRFRDMEQENLSTGRKRQVRRRPSYSTTQSSVQTSLSSALSTLNLLGVSPSPKWQFSGGGNRWYNFTHRVGTDTECSTDSALIEAEYQKNPKGSMNFTVNGQSYLLDFTAMTQTNTSTKATRRIRRV